MGKKIFIFDYKILVSFLFLDGIFDFFDVIDVSEEYIGKYVEIGVEKIKLYIYFDEWDICFDEWYDFKFNGFIESCEVIDFFVCDCKVILYVWCCWWIDSEGYNVVFNCYDLVVSGISYLKEFVDVLKKIFGYVFGYGMFCGVDL